MSARGDLLHWLRQCPEVTQARRTYRGVAVRFALGTTSARQIEIALVIRGWLGLPSGRARTAAAPSPGQRQAPQPQRPYAPPRGGGLAA